MLIKTNSRDYISVTFLSCISGNLKLKYFQVLYTFPNSQDS